MDCHVATAPRSDARSVHYAAAPKYIVIARPQAVAIHGFWLVKEVTSSHHGLPRRYRSSQ
jgi:hypothetical protein